MTDLSTKTPLDISYDQTEGRLVITTPGGLVVHIEDPREAKTPSKTPDVVITPDEDSLRINARQSLSVNSMGHLNLSGQDGVTINSGGDVTVVADRNVTTAAGETLSLNAADIKADATKTFTGTSGEESTLISDGETIVRGAMIRIN
ncbi:hypothetical protein [Litoreibacter arenae]|uniref:VgrG protein n=1 Tax=Litoreibacter arenae DSM 19593 TaxID=1123360 RepID=S9QCV4_9RHOB|nr:hypothetical protein [Litoreibacter arenae]EPX79261.1 hypothetical protein thalar_02086 [Litoreibacter arenae DSM 19593]